MLPLWYKRSCVAWMLKLSSTLVNGQTTRWTQVKNNSKTSHRSAILKVPKVQIPRKVWDGLSHPQAPCAWKTREPLKLWRGLEPYLNQPLPACRRRADVSNFLCCTRKRDLFPFPRGTKEIGNAYTQAKPTREINDTRGVRHLKVPITFRARKAVLCLILKMIRWKYKSTKQNWLTGLWARRCANIQQVLISKFASGPENFPRLCSRIVSVLT